MNETDDRVTAHYGNILMLDMGGGLCTLKQPFSSTNLSLVLAKWPTRRHSLLVMCLLQSQLRVYLVKIMDLKSSN